MNFYNIQELVNNDTLNFEADPKIQNRLRYHLQLKSASSKIRMNSFTPTLSSILNMKTLVWKIGLATVMLLAVFSYRQTQNNGFYFTGNDSIVVNQITDSSVYKLENDSTWKN
ncbi:MAG: hypothetical protein MI922_14760 [Bacteroidales bacterium]|nr:hypothetical protein [Bacteroidales bacterium]